MISLIYFLLIEPARVVAFSFLLCDSFRVSKRLEGQYMLTGLVMAGGNGERFWPLSTPNNPKQFLSIFDDLPLVRKAYDRLRRIMDQDKIFVSVNEIQLKHLKEIIPELHPDRIIIEPARKDTAAAIGYGCMVISKYFDNPLIAVVDSDHIIKDEDAFLDTLNLAFMEANKGAIVTLGLIPNRPETAYGYIHCPNYKLGVPSISLGFKEKPNLEKAKEYFASKEYLWNSGMFIFRYETLMDAFKSYSNEHYQTLLELSALIKKTPDLRLLHSKVSSVFSHFASISIDYAIMEKASNIVVIPSSFGWYDVGSYSAFDELYPKDSDGNISVKAKCFKVDSNNNIVISETPDVEIGLLGVSDMVIVVSKKKVLVCSKSRVPDLKLLMKKVNEDK